MKNKMASLEKQLTKTSTYVKEHADELQDIQANLDDLEQFSRKNSLEVHGIPDEVNMRTNQVVCKTAQAIGVEILIDFFLIPKSLIASTKTANIKTAIAPDQAIRIF